MSEGSDQNQNGADKPHRPENMIAPRSPESGGAPHKASQIPQFDLAEQIMAEQRKVAATRRKGPAGRATAPVRRRPQPTSPAVEPLRVSSEEEKVVAEIVARDIENLCRGRVPGTAEESKNSGNCYI